MADKSSVTRAQAEAHRRALAALLKLDANRRCAECGGRGPTWASVNLGVFVCLNCSGVHRSLGTHISKVRSATLDTWLPSQVAFAARMGNARAASFWEAELPQGFARPAEGDMAALSKFIGDKYREKRYASRAHGDVPPTLETAEGHPFLAQFESGGAAAAGGGGGGGATAATTTTATATTAPVVAPPRAPAAPAAPPAPAPASAAALVDLLSLDDPPQPVNTAAAAATTATATTATAATSNGGGDWAAFADDVSATPAPSTSSTATTTTAAAKAPSTAVVDPHDWDAFLAAEPLAAPSTTTTAPPPPPPPPTTTTQPRHHHQPPPAPGPPPPVAPPAQEVSKSTADKHADILSLFDRPMAARPPAAAQSQQWQAAFSPPSFASSSSSSSPATKGGGGSKSNGGGGPLF